MRLIDADALITNILMCRTIDGRIHLEDVLRCIKDMPAAGIWISVKDRLPKQVSAMDRMTIEPVLLYSPKGGIYIGWYYGEDWRGRKEFINRTSRDSWQYITTKVTFWMPLPEKPEEEKHEAD